MADIVPIRPIRWGSLRTNEAETLVRARAGNNAIIWSAHAFERIIDRSITRVDAQRILLTGYIEADMEQQPNGDWKVIVTKKIKGRREAGIVTLILREDEKLFVKTVEWMD